MLGDTEAWLLESKAYLDPAFGEDGVPPDCPWVPEGSETGAPHQSSMVAMLTRLRLDRARVLLLTTDLSIEGIAHSSGFETESDLVAAFLNATGKTPVMFRNELGTKSLFEREQRPISPV